MNDAHAVVLGGGLAGTFAAAALAPHVGGVTVVERDALPDGPRPRRGVPQAQHLHVLMSGGARAMDTLLPGTTDRLCARGAHRHGVPEDVVTLSADGWQHRFPATEYMLTCSRDLIDWTVREAVLALPEVSVRYGQVDGLVGTAQRIGGVVVDGETVTADLVVDCTGRGSRVRQWLDLLGAAVPEEEVVDSGLAYSTRVFAAPRGAETGFPVVNLFADYRSGEPGRSASLVPVEHGRWIISLTGTRGATPPVDAQCFAEYAESLRDPLIARLMRAAEPLTAPQGSRSAANRRLHCGRDDSWPEGLVVLGDALVAFNPVYGQGMSTAARGALALSRVLADGAGATVSAQAVQRAVDDVVEAPWTTATSQDVRYPHCRTSLVDPAALAPTAEGDRLSRWVGELALRDPVVSEAMTEVITVNSTLAVLERPRVAAAMTGAGARPPLHEAPLREPELRILDAAPVAR
ncbi:2-polyprenyl-6-methoxyphenol hydroxylase [Prauserella aidingensis]|uniref:FAD-dependent oxidoreductase n=1 Tax=Prauserella aidingensis TaxID=387890 RepID=UPI0020A4524C|nr:FAD-dependent monooxygenase [Prauserella aidingensis]MCP2253279.1 2-polyprenyl-6-methoxyphenol hydroxylase [Prauserella aidingensis]